MFNPDTESIEDDRLVYFAIRVVAANMADNKNGAIFSLKGAGIVSRPWHIEFSPGTSPVCGPPDSVCGDVKQDAFAGHQQFGHPGMREKRGNHRAGFPGLSLPGQQTLATFLTEQLALRGIGSSTQD